MQFVDDITEEKADDSARINTAKDWLDKMSSATTPSFLTYLMSISGGDRREFFDCLYFLREEQKKIDKIGMILHQLDEGPIEDVDTLSQAELRQICEGYEVAVKEENKNAIRACLEEERKNISIDMAIPDLGYEPGCLYSPVDVLQELFDAYCMTFEKEDADINAEMANVLSWIDENITDFQALE